MHKFTDSVSQTYIFRLNRGNKEEEWRKGSPWERGRWAFSSANLPERRFLESRRVRILKGSGLVGYPIINAWDAWSKER